MTLNDIDTVEENFPKYYDPRRYPWPHDDQEKKRMEVLHELCWLAHDNRIALCPEEKYRNVLDLGTGDGTWAIEFADMHEEATVIGVDMHRFQPTFVPPNCEFQIDNLEEDWTWSGCFDFIHARMLSGCFKKPRHIVSSAYKYVTLESQGYINANGVCMVDS